MYLKRGIERERRPDLSQARFMEDSVYHVRPGQVSEFHEVVKMVIAGYKKAGTAAHWGTFDINYGRPAGDYLVLSSRRSISEIDTEFAEDQKFVEALGEDGMKKLNELAAASIETSDHELFRSPLVRAMWTSHGPKLTRISVTRSRPHRRPWRLE